MTQIFQELRPKINTVWKVLVGVGVVALVVLLTFLSNSGNGTSPIEAFQIGSSSVPKTNVLQKTATIPADKQAQLYVRYEPKKLTNVTIKLFTNNNKERFSSGAIPLHNQGNFSLSLKEHIVAPGNYTVKLFDQTQKVVWTSSLKISGQ